MNIFMFFKKRETKDKENIRDLFENLFGKIDASCGNAKVYGDEHVFGNCRVYGVEKRPLIKETKNP